MSKRKVSSRKAAPKRGSKPKRASGPTKKEVATFAALLKGHNKSN